MSGRNEPWAAEDYERHFDFVSAYGREVVALLAPQPGERILDLGCGTGALSAEIARAGAEVVGVDADANMIASARRLHPTVTFQQADAHAFTTQEPFDAVFSNAALHWMVRPAAVVRSVQAALKPGGRFVAEMGSRGNIATVVEALRRALEQAGVPRAAQAEPWYFPTPGEQCALLERHGFVVRFYRSFERLTPVEGGAEGLREWLRMFAPSLLGQAPAGRVEAVLDDVERETRERLYRDDRWVIDYKRLRFLAVRR